MKLSRKNRKTAPVSSGRGKLPLSRPPVYGCLLVAAPDEGLIQTFMLKIMNYKIKKNWYVPSFSHHIPLPHQSKALI